MGRDRHEALASLVGIAGVMAFTLFVLASGLVDNGQFGRMLTLYVSGAFGLWLVAGLIGAAVLLIRQRPFAKQAQPPLEVLRRWAVERWRRDRLVSLAWPPLLFGALMAVFNAYKQMILITADFRHDALFAAIDRALFLGFDPWRLTHALFGGPIATSILDKAYHGWFVPMSLGVIVCAFLPASSYRLRTQYLLSYVGVWIGIGGVLAYLLPAAGPCFYDIFAGGGDFAPLMARLEENQTALRALAPGAQLDALGNQAVLLAAYGSDELTIGGGISAMPSVHNALSALFALAAFRIHRAAGWAMSGYALLIWIGSVHLGWHYAIDGIVSIALTCWIWRETGRFADWLQRLSPVRAASLAPA